MWEEDDEVANAEMKDNGGCLLYRPSFEVAPEAGRNPCKLVVALVGA